MRMRPNLGWLLLGLALGCASAPKQTLPPPHAMVDPSEPPPAEYRIATGDEIQIVLPMNPELNVQTFVRPDGKISLELIDEVKAEGLTTTELTEQLQNAYATELRDPDISVNIVSMAARVYVDGRVGKPGEYPWARQVTAMQAIALAGGLDETAETTQVIVVRRGPGGEQQIFDINLDEVTSGKGPSRDLFLEPYDTVYVPSTRIADVNKWVDQYLRQNVPITPKQASVK